MAKAVQNFRKHLQAYMNKADEQTEQFIWHFRYRFTVRNLASERNSCWSTDNLSARLFF